MSDITIREATQEDVLEIVKVGRAMHEESPRFSRLKYSPHKMIALVTGLLNTQRGFVIIAEKEGEIVGGVLAAVAEHWASTDLVAFEYGIYLLPEYRQSMLGVRLIKRYVKWAQDMGVKEGLISLGISTGINTERTIELYKRLGFKPATYGFEA